MQSQTLTRTFTSFTHILQRNISISAFAALTPMERRNYVPAALPKLSTPKSFLTKIGRDSVVVADKFKSWEHLMVRSTN
jgi:IGR protein motif